MSIIESTRKMEPNEEMCHKMGFSAGKESMKFRIAELTACAEKAEAERDTLQKIPDMYGACDHNFCV